MNEIILNENYPLSQLEEGETSLIIPDDTSKNLVPRNFTVTRLGNVFRIVDSEFSEPHNISSDLMLKLTETALEDEEICELFLTIHESLQNIGDFKKTKNMVDLVLKILEKEDPFTFFRNIKYFDNVDIASIFTSEDPYIAYKDLISIYDIEIDDDAEEAVEVEEVY